MRIRSSFRFLLFLAWRDFVSSYQGSFAGVIWGVVEPLFYITLTFFFFQYVVGGALIGGHAYATYVLPPMLAWLVVNGGMMSAVGVISQYKQFLHEHFDLRTIVFIKLLPILSIHVLMVTMLATFFYFSGIVKDFSPFYLIYAVLCLIASLVGIFWLLMSISPFIKDVRNFVGIVLQFGFWIVPIFWEANRFPDTVAWIVRLEPFYYPLQTYRVAFNGGGDGLFTASTAIFWATCIGLFYCGHRTYLRARPHFGDVV